MSAQALSADSRERSVAPEPGTALQRKREPAWTLLGNGLGFSLGTPPRSCVR